MSIRSEAMPYRGELSYQLQDLLRRNGMRAQLAVQGDRYLLIVQGHDSPLLEYPISEQQFRALADGGTNYANKNAYKTFNNIVGKDFDMPSSYVAARNVNGRVAMGLHGYRERYLGWTPRMQDGFHLRRVAGVAMVPEHTDGRLRPGELKSGSYGYYYKGRQEAPAVQDPLKDLQNVFPPVVARPRPQEPAKPYNELVTSDVYFTNEKWQECLASHGIIIDENAKTLTIQSNSVNADMVYDLTDEELKKLTSNSIKEVPVVQRLELLNGIIKDDFADKILMDTLNSKERIDLHLHPELEQELQQRQQQDEERLLPLEEDETVRRDVLQGDAMVRGEDLALINENKGWYREGAHGREVKVGDIMVEKVPPMEGDKKGEDKYRMTAIINGEAITHEIKQKDYDKFLAVDDYHRMKLFSKVFSEVDMKTRPETNAGLGTKILAALTAGAVVTAEVAHDISHHHHHPAPEFYAEHHGGPRPYFKPGVDSPQEIAARYFEAEANHVATEIRRGY